MQTIKERADRAIYEPTDGHPLKACEVVAFARGYELGATEQKAIDDAKWLKIKASWEKEAQITHDDKANYQQGFHDAIEKACEWLDNYLMEIGYPDDWLRDSPNMKSGKERFRKAIEE